MLLIFKYIYINFANEVYFLEKNKVNIDFKNTASCPYD